MEEENSTILECWVIEDLNAWAHLPVRVVGLRPNSHAANIG